MDAPCQRIVWDVLPAIRAAVAVQLVKCGVSQAEAAKLLHLVPATISQYVSGKRGYRIVFEGGVQQSIEKLAEDLKRGEPIDLTLRICEICRLLREGETQCQSEGKDENEGF
jgi:predicted transcriptional regulator